MVTTIGLLSPQDIKHIQPFLIYLIILTSEIQYVLINKDKKCQKNMDLT